MILKRTVVPGILALIFVLLAIPGAVSAEDSMTVSGVILPAPPVAAFSASPVSGVLPLSVTFTDTSTGTIDSWKWEYSTNHADWTEFGSCVQNPVFIFNTAGTYDIRLTVTNSGGSDDETREGYIAVLESNGLADTAWPKFHYDLLNTGRSPVTGPQTGTVAWNYKTGSGIEGSASIAADGTIYVGCYDHNLYAVNPDGTLRWKYLTGGILSGSPAVAADGTIYVGSRDKKIYAVNPDGTLKWSYTTGGQIYSSPAVGIDGTVYIGSLDKKVYALNPDGSLKWSYSTGLEVHSSPAVGADGMVYIGSSNGVVYALNPDGTRQWSYGTGSAIYSSPAIGTDGTVYVGNNFGTIVALNPDGTFKWLFPTGGPVYSSPAVGTDGSIYIGSNDNRVYALNPTGTLRWSYDTGNDIYSSPALGADGTVYIGGYNNKVYALKPDGTLKWSYTTGGQIRSPPSIGSDGTLYIGSMDYRLYAFRDVGPVAAFTWTPATVTRGVAATFDAGSSSGSITSYTWTFGDGDSGSGEIVTHTYGTYGDRTVMLTVTGPAGTDDLSKTIHVTEPAPAVTFTPTAASVTEGAGVPFDATNAGGAVTTWAWYYKLHTDPAWTAFGPAYTVEDPTFILPAEGTYDVKVMATGPDYVVSTTNENCVTVGASSFAITVGSPSLSLGTMSVSDPGENSVSVDVTATAGAGWSVTAADLSNGGKMMAGTTPLTNGFLVSESDGSTMHDLAAAANHRFTFMTGSGSATKSGTAGMQQVIAPADGAGDYSITITFTGSVD